MQFDKPVANAMSAFEYLHSVFCDVVVGAPSALPSFVNRVNVDKCALHGSRMPTRTCASMLLDEPAVSDSKSITISTLSMLPCDCSQQTLLADLRFAKLVMERSPDAFQRCFSRSVSFSKLAEGPSIPIGDVRSDFCYLRLLVVKMRVRVARILGPEPHVADLLLFYILAGFVGGNSLALRNVGPGKYHVVNSRHKLPYNAFAQELRYIVEIEPNARIGYGSLGSSQCVTDYLTMYRSLQLSDGNRAAVLAEWMNIHFAMENAAVESALPFMLMLTCANEALTKELKYAKRYWSIVGENSMRLLTSTNHFALKHSVETYSLSCQAQSVTCVAKVLERCGLAIAVSAFRVEARVANAETMRAAFGYLATVVDNELLLRFMLRYELVVSVVGNV